jgi:hypothetical protein
MTTMSILDLKEFAATLGSHVSTTPMSTSSRLVLGTPRLQGEGGFSCFSRGSFARILFGSEIDLSIFNARYQNDEIGASVYDPSIPFKIILYLYAYSRGITSSRKDSGVLPEEHHFHGVVSRHGAALYDDYRLHFDLCYGKRATAILDK